MAGVELNPLAKLRVENLLYDFHAIRFPNSQIHMAARNVEVVYNRLGFAAAKTVPEITLLTKTDTSELSAVWKSQLILGHLRPVAAAFQEAQTQQPATDFLLEQSNGVWKESPGIAEDLTDDTGTAMEPAAILPESFVVEAMFKSCKARQTRHCRPLETFIAQLEHQ